MILKQINILHKLLMLTFKSRNIFELSNFAWVIEGRQLPLLLELSNLTSIGRREITPLASVWNY